MKIEFVIFVLIGTLVVAAIYSASTYFVFAEKICAAGTTDPKVYYCVITEKQTIEACEMIGGKWTFVQLTSTSGDDIPADLRDAIVKADSVKPDVKGGNTTKVPKDLGGLNNGGNGPSVNPGSD